MGHDLDIAFTYSGYAPLSVRLVQYALSPSAGWKGAEEALRLIPGAYFDEKDPRVHPGSGTDVKQIMICFVGGVTFCEIAALR